MAETPYDINFLFAVLGQTTAELAYVRTRLAQFEARLEPKPSNGIVDHASIPEEVDAHA